MKFSKTWLQSYSAQPLPETKKLEEMITLNAFEVEEVVSLNGDDILDIKVLPNRAHDALAHRGMSKDITALSGTTFIDKVDYYSGPYDKGVATPHIEIDDERACTRFMSARVEGVVVTESPLWLKAALASIGQKSINSIVDITNYVQFAINKPMHAYDAALIQDGTLVARYAKKGEVLTTLDDKDLTLNTNTLIIADTKKPLGLAGIKGGKYSGISPTTTSVILESANFNQSLIRKTSQAYGIRTDASKRFENELSDSLVEEGIRMTLSLIKQLNPNAKVSEVVDIYPKKEERKAVQVTVEDINSLLGTGYSEEEVCGVLNDLAFSFTKEGETILVTPPEERLDIRIKEDITEEVLRIKGLSSVPSVLPSINRKGVPHKRLYYENKIKNILFAHGFSDIMTYSFGNEGEVMIKKGLASDKEHLRSTLSSGLLSAFALNMQNSPLLKINLIKMYEFGNVFSKEGEKRELAILVDDGKKKSSYGEDIDYILSEIKRELVAPSVDYQVISSKPCTVVIDFDALISTLPEPASYEPLVSHALTTPYQPISAYPFIVRDIAVFVPTSTSWEDVLAVISTHQSPLVISVDLFDTFSKTFEDGTQKTSYGCRLVLQSHERTLTDEEANQVADNVYGALKEKGWEIR